MIINELFSLEGSVALVTGSYRGNGRSIAEGLASAGARVVGWDLSLPDKDSAGLIDNQICDITNSSTVDVSLKYIIDNYGKIDVLINNAGVSYSHDFLTYPQELWDKTYAINLQAPFSLIQKVGQLMIKEGGSIVNITSLNSEQAFPDNPAYVAFKGALKQLSKSAAVDLGKYNIRVNNVGPGYFKTNMTQKSWENVERREHLSNKTILGRWGDPSDLTGVIIFLSSRASSYITGQDIYVDGGWLSKGL